MTLSDLIRKGGLGRAATATTATLATHGAEKAGTVVIVATVAVASSASPNSEVAGEATAWGWLLHFTDRKPVEAYFSPAATRAEALAAYPGAIGAEPISQSPRRTPTDAEAAELRALVRTIGEHDAWTAQDIEDATAAALADPDGALRCYRAIAEERGSVLLSDEDDRRRCDQCANLTERGLCLAARRGDIVASREYRPVPALPRRCEGYAPKATDTDQRLGRERWPGLTTKGGDHADT